MSAMVSTSTGAAVTEVHGSEAAEPASARLGQRPPARRRPGRWLLWLLVILVVLGVVAWQLLNLLAGSTQLGLQPDDPAPKGAMALVRVLEQHGVKVMESDSLAATITAAQRPDTLVLVNEQDVELTAAQRTRLAAAASSLVLLAPDFQALGDYGLDLRLRASVDSGAAVAANCELGGLGADDRVTGSGPRYLAGSGESERTTVECVGDAQHGFGLVRLSGAQGSGGRLVEVTVIGATGSLRNDTIDQGGNAAFAINTLGGQAKLVWYTPGADDIPASATPAPTQPTWYAMAVAVLVGVLLAAALWRGRRLGPLVVERLPVIVPARETVEGRARLYASASARLRALDAIRAASATRLAMLCGLGPSARLPEIIDQTAWLTGIARERVAEALADAVPRRDRDMLQLARELGRIEDLTARAVGRAPSGQTGQSTSEGAE